MGAPSVGGGVPGGELGGPGGSPSDLVGNKHVAPMAPSGPKTGTPHGLAMKMLCGGCKGHVYNRRSVGAEPPPSVASAFARICRPPPGLRGERGLGALVAPGRGPCPPPGPPALLGALGLFRIFPFLVWETLREQRRVEKALTPNWDLPQDKSRHPHSPYTCGGLGCEQPPLGDSATVDPGEGGGPPAGWGSAAGEGVGRTGKVLDPPRRWRGFWK